MNLKLYFEDDFKKLHVSWFKTEKQLQLSLIIKVKIKAKVKI